MWVWACSWSCPSSLPDQVPTTFLSSLIQPHQPLCCSLSYPAHVCPGPLDLSKSLSGKLIPRCAEVCRATIVMQSLDLLHTLTCFGFLHNASPATLQASRCSFDGFLSPLLAQPATGTQHSMEWEFCTCWIQQQKLGFPFTVVGILQPGEIADLTSQNSTEWEFCGL